MRIKLVSVGDKLRAICTRLIYQVIGSLPNVRLDLSNKFSRRNRFATHLD